MKIVVFGSGMVARKLLAYPVKKEHTILYVCDNDSTKWGSRLAGYEIKAPEEVIKADMVLLAVVSGWMDVMKQLQDYGIPEDKILHAVGWSKLDYFTDPLDNIFDIEKKPFVPFEKKPVKSLGHCGGETGKAHERRIREGFFEKYCIGQGLDIGCGNDPVVDGCCGWDLMHGDAQYLTGIADEEFDWVYSSHCLEHVDDVRIALKNWFRVVRRGGYLLLYIPHRDLYEKKLTLPSRFNPHHKHMFLIGKKDPPDTLDIVEEIRESLHDYEIQYVRICDGGYIRHGDTEQSEGEYSIECVIRKH